jgi:hypothetical protein
MDDTYPYSKVEKEWLSMTSGEREFCFKVYKDQYKIDVAPTYNNVSDNWVNPHNIGFIVCIDKNCFVVANKLRAVIGYLLGVYCE